MATGHAGQMAIVLKHVAMGGPTEQALLFDEGGKSIILTVGKVVPGDGLAGYVKGACLLLVDHIGRVLEIYSNSGSMESCTFTRTDA